MPLTNGTCQGGVNPEEGANPLPRQVMHDETRKLARLAARLKEKHEGNKTAIAREIGVSDAYVSMLLHYERFFSRPSAPPELSMGKFQAYWRQVNGRRAKDVDPEYEEQCFRDIEAMVREGREPFRDEKVIRRLDAADIESIAKLKEQLELRMAALRPELKRLRGMLGADRSTYAPSMMAGSAQIIDREFAAIETLLAGFGGRKEPAAPAREP